MQHRHRARAIGHILRLVDEDTVREREFFVAKPCDQQLVHSIR